MKTFSAIYLIFSFFVLPCTLNLEKGWCLVAIVVNVMVSFVLFYKHNPEYILKDNKNNK